MSVCQQYASKRRSSEQGQEITVEEEEKETSAREEEENEAREQAKTYRTNQNAVRRGIEQFPY